MSVNTYPPSLARPVGLIVTGASEECIGVRRLVVTRPDTFGLCHCERSVAVLSLGCGSGSLQGCCEVNVSLVPLVGVMSNI